MRDKKNKNIWVTLNYIQYLLNLPSEVIRCYSYMHHKFCSKIKELFNNFKNQKVQVYNYRSTFIYNDHKLNIIEVLISKTLKDSKNSHGDFLSVNNVLIEYNNMKKEIKTLKTSTVYQRFWSIYKTILSLFVVWNKYSK